MKIKILHIINSFEYGGAESMLCNLLSCVDRGRFEPAVVSLIDDLRVAGSITDAAIPLSVLGMKPGVPDPRGVARLARLLGKVRPHLIQTWMDHSNLIGGLAARLSVRAPVVWGVHHSNHIPGLTKRTTLMTVAACARLSRRLPARIVCCSESARTAYVARGFAAERMTVIPNGFDTDVFRPNPEARAEVRRELGVASETPLVGLVARYDPFKDHANFLRAAAIVAQHLPHVRFLLCGDRIDSGNGTLMGLIEALGLQDRCHLLGPRRDVPRLHAALDLLVSSSASEAFPLTIGEAMACGVPCAATHVGDSAAIVGETGRVVPPGDPQALAAACEALLRLEPAEREWLGWAARQRIQDRFSLGAIAVRYEALYAALAAGEPRPEFPVNSPALGAEVVTS
ncbi:MAG: glycosyltransferase [Isosphaeraceae bacterium]|nr:glycosyltransferase [Isosphaeraceae bacterium]